MKNVTKMNRNKGVTRSNARILALRLARDRLTIKGTPSAVTITEGLLCFTDEFIYFDPWKYG
jgi:hypothetical protein